MYILKITPKETKPKEGEKPGKVAPKGRAFSVAFLGGLLANNLWAGGQTQTETYRPVLFSVAGLPTEVNPFSANIAMGRTADILENDGGYNRGKPDRLEVPKSAGFIRFVEQLPNGNLIATFYLRELFSLETGMVDPSGVTFVAAPPTWWVNQQLLLLDNNDKAALVQWAERSGVLNGNHALRFSLTPDQLFTVAVNAAYTIGHVDKRTSNPILNDVVFWTQVYINGIARKIFQLTPTAASLDRGRWSSEEKTAKELETDVWAYARPTSHTGFATLKSTAFEKLGYSQIVACNVNHDVLNKFLVGEIQSYLQGK